METTMRSTRITFRLPRHMKLADLPVRQEARTAHQQLKVDFYVAYGPATVNQGMLLASPNITAVDRFRIGVVAFVCDAEHGFVGRCQRDVTIVPEERRKVQT